MRKKEQAKKMTGKPGPPPDDVLDLKGAAAFLKVSKPTFYRWLAQGKLKGFKAGQQWRFYRRDLEDFLRSDEPSALQVDAGQLEQAVARSRRARGLPPVKWEERAESDVPGEAAVIRVLNTIISDAIAGRASDIHLDNNPEETLIRYRVDGVLREAMTLPREASRALVSRLKILGDLDVTERRLPQHGRIHIKQQDKDYDLRVTTMPGIFGESAIARILDQRSPFFGLGELGFSKPRQQAFEGKLRSPTGLIVVTGPSGSGRTTTLYSALSLINSREKKIVSIEDPVEYRLPDTMQVHVNRKAGLTPAVAMRALVRCDPDILLVGDLRDLETAEVCMQAAMTGHLVLTAMLPGDAPSVLARLTDMGVEPFLVSASVIAVLAQRLVRVLCPHCKTDHRPPPDVLRRAGMAEEEIAGGKFYRGAGCERCRQFGYRGRTALFELLEVDDRLRELIARRAPLRELREAAAASGMTTMLQDGLEKARQGVTAVEEVLRVLVSYQGG
jgi:type IV pilus assembly protein PilB